MSSQTSSPPSDVDDSSLNDKQILINFNQHEKICEIENIFEA